MTTNIQLKAGHWRKAMGLALASILAMTAAPAGAQTAVDWPQKAVKIVVPYAAGGSADTLGRLIADYLSTATKQAFLVDNKGGAGGTLGSIQVSKAPPDGYTLVVSGIGSHVIAPVQLGNAMDPIKDFSHIALLGGPPIAFVVNASLPIRTVDEFKAYANSNPKGVSWGSPGMGTHGHLIGELFKAQDRLNMVHIGYKGAGPAVIDLLGGQIQAGFMTLSSANSHVQSGKLRLLAVSAPKRVKDFPDAPTFVELGYPKLVALTWFSLSGPPGMPLEITTKLNGMVRRGLQSPAVKELMATEGMLSQDLDVDAFNQFMKSEIELWTPLVKSTLQSKG